MLSLLLYVVLFSLDAVFNYVDPGSLNSTRYRPRTHGCKDDFAQFGQRELRLNR